MIEWAVDGLLYILLLAAVGFGGISVIGLLIFPDSRSRAFTGLRAGIISLALVAAAGIFYGLFLWTTTGEMQYVLFALAAILMLILVVVLNRISSDMVCRRSVPALSPQKEREEKS
jgi:multisubunit Na+/H+ antiporter MnhG subunit